MRDQNVSQHPTLIRHVLVGMLCLWNLGCQHEPIRMLAPSLEVGSSIYSGNPWLTSVNQGTSHATLRLVRDELSATYEVRLLIDDQRAMADWLRNDYRAAGNDSWRRSPEDARDGTWRPQRVAYPVEGEMIRLTPGAHDVVIQFVSIPTRQSQDQPIMYEYLPPDHLIFKVKEHERWEVTFYAQDGGTYYRLMLVGMGPGEEEPPTDPPHNQEDVPEAMQSLPSLILNSEPLK